VGQAKRISTCAEEDFKSGARRKKMFREVRSIMAELLGERKYVRGTGEKKTTSDDQARKGGKQMGETSTGAGDRFGGSFKVLRGGG